MTMTMPRLPWLWSMLAMPMNLIEADGCLLVIHQSIDPINHSRVRVDPVKKRVSAKFPKCMVIDEQASQFFAISGTIMTSIPQSVLDLHRKIVLHLSFGRAIYEDSHPNSGCEAHQRLLRLVADSP
jgi:hypothetical protein